MEKNINNEELQSRRMFFKKAAKGALPIFALTVLGSSLLTSCQKDDDKDGCKNSCIGSCQENCSGSCKTTCSGSCKSTCSGSSEKKSGGMSAGMLTY